MTIVYPEDEYNEFWASEYRILTPLKRWLESQGYFCTLNPPETCLRIWSTILGVIPWNVVIMVCIKGRIEVFDKKHTLLAERIKEQIHSLGEPKDE